MIQQKRAEAAQMVLAFKALQADAAEAKRQVAAIKTLHEEETQKMWAEITRIEEDGASAASFARLADERARALELALARIRQLEAQAAGEHATQAQNARG